MMTTENPVKSTAATQSIFDNNAQSTKSQAVSPLVISNIDEKYKISVYPHCVEFKTFSKKGESSGRRRNERGNIKTFSKKSRFNLFRMLAKMKEDYTLQPMFLTLTYHHGHEQKVRSTKSQLHHFLVMLRQYDPEVHFIWRLEFQKRRAPHYHLIVFPGNPPFDVDEEKYQLKISHIWHSIADPKSRAHAEYGCKIVPIDSYRKACGYLSKYVAKVDDKMDGIEVGKHWGCSRNLPFDRIEHYECYALAAHAIIEKLRKWLVKNGKSQYATPEYFNFQRDQLIFIDHEQWEQDIHHRDEVENMIEEESERLKQHPEISGYIV